MDKLLEYINIKTNNVFADIKISNLIFNRKANIITVKIIYKKERNEITEKERELLGNIIKEFLNVNVTVDVKTKKALIDEDVIIDVIYNYIKTNYASLTTFKKRDINVKIIENEVNAEINFIDIYYDFLVNQSFENKLADYLQSNFFEKFNLNINRSLNNDNGFILEEHIKKVTQICSAAPKTNNYINVGNVQAVIGEKITQKPLCINSVKQPSSAVAIAGNIKFITKRSFISKKKNEQGEFIQKDYFSFSIFNDNSYIRCVMFLNAKDIEKMEELEENEFIVALGDVEKFNEQLNFKVKKLSLAESLDDNTQNVVERQENSNYIFVKPANYIMMEQPDIFNINNNEINEFLQKNTVVVFDLETTGLEASSNEIIEIGAVKIVNGKITETFSSLVKPNEEISEEITGLTGITNEMVAGAYTIEQVLPDFYKFTRGAVLSAYNISFDYNFLYVAAYKQGYVFNNAQIDTMYLAKTKVKNAKNYKLKTIASVLNIKLENAHRAVNDALATAEIFIKLSDDLK